MQAVLYALENFARRMVHLFPTNPTAQVCLGLMLRRRACLNGTRPVPQALRRQLEQVGLLAVVLAFGVWDAPAVDCLQGWSCSAAT